MKVNMGFILKDYCLKWLQIVSSCFVTVGGVILLKHASVVTGGTAGLSLSLSHLLPVPFHYAFMLLNLPFFVFSYFFMGRAFTARTIAAIAILSAISAIDSLLPHFSIPPAIGSIAGGAFIGAGITSLFRSGASLGGATIVAVYLHKRYGLNPGKTNFAFDLLVVLTSLFVLPLVSGLWSALSIAVTSGVIAYFKRKRAGTTARVEQHAETKQVRLHAKWPANRAG